MKKLLFASLLLLTLASCEKPSDYTLKIEYFSINKEPDTVVVTGRYDNNVCRVETYREATPVFTSNGRQYLHVSRIEILDKQPTKHKYFILLNDEWQFVLAIILLFACVYVLSKFVFGDIVNPKKK